MEAVDLEVDADADAGGGDGGGGGVEVMAEAMSVPRGAVLTTYRLMEIPFCLRRRVERTQWTAKARTRTRWDKKRGSKTRQPNLYVPPRHFSKPKQILRICFGFTS
jgi:hypothetical protein